MRQEYLLSFHINLAHMFRSHTRCSLKTKKARRGIHVVIILGTFLKVPKIMSEVFKNTTDTPYTVVSVSNFFNHC